MNEPGLVRPADVPGSPPGETPIAALPFRLRTLDALRTAGVQTVEALCRLAPAELTRRGCGDATIQDVDVVLAAHALALAAPRDDGETPLETLGLSAPTKGALRVAGVYTVETLCWLTPAELSRVHRLGADRAREVTAALGERGFSLRAPAPSEEDADPAPFPTPADVAAVLAAARQDGVAHTPAGERLRYVARRLAGLVPPRVAERRPSGTPRRVP